MYFHVDYIDAQYATPVARSMFVIHVFYMCVCVLCVQVQCNWVNLPPCPYIASVEYIHVCTCICSCCHRVSEFIA